jgi:hypothetical protein
VVIRDQKDRIRADMRKMIEQGWRIQDQNWINHSERTCCAMGACFLVTPPVEIGNDIDIEIASILGVTLDEIFDFTRGFDGEAEKNSDAYHVGLELRREFLDSHDYPFPTEYTDDNQ